jgi:hypothetical protein
VSGFSAVLNEPTMNEAFTTGSSGLRCNEAAFEETPGMNSDPQTPISENGPRSAGPTEPTSGPSSTGAPRFPIDALRDGLNHRLNVNMPVWAVIVISLVLVVAALD